MSFRLTPSSLIPMLRNVCFTLEVRPLRRLRQLLVRRRGHVSPDLDQDGLHGEIALPGAEGREFGEINLLHDKNQHAALQTPRVVCMHPLRMLASRFALGHLPSHSSDPHKAD
jgi:hypothetical protein